MNVAGAVAQQVEHWTCDQQVVGSNPTHRARLCASVTKLYNLVPAKGR